MRKNKVMDQPKDFSILALDDDRLMTETLQSYFQAAGYRVDIENDPLQAIERLRATKYDILLLDFLMHPICGDEVVRQIREFDRDLFIILLTGHKSLAPPIRTIRELDIQGYYEKSDRFDQLELLVASCTKSILQMRVIRKYRDGLRRVLDCVPVLNQQQSLEHVLDQVLEQTAEILPAAEGFLYLDLSVLVDAQQLETSRLSPFRGSGQYQDQQDYAKQLYQLLSKSNRPVDILPEERLILAPLFASGHRRFGLLAVRLSRPAAADDAQLFEVYAKQIGSVVSNVILRAMLQNQNAQLSKTYASLRKNHLEMIDAMRKMVDAKDFYTRGHSDRVSFYAVKIAQAMGKSPEYIDRLRLAGLFHDIGKVGVPDGILQKAGPLTDEEYARIKQHPVVGAKILSSISQFHEILPIVLAHHERYDGHGYPNGLAGDQIPEEARIISAADSFDAMTSQRTYRSSLSLEEAEAELLRGRGTQFDPAIINVFLEVLQDFPSLRQELDWTFSDTVLFQQEPLPYLDRETQKG